MGELKRLVEGVDYVITSGKVLDLWVAQAVASDSEVLLTVRSPNSREHAIQDLRDSLNRIHARLALKK
jgi:hypothetical protein